jgi:hypothetical protein
LYLCKFGDGGQLGLWWQALCDDAPDPHGKGAAQFGILRPGQASGQALDSGVGMAALTEPAPFHLSHPPFHLSHPTVRPEPSPVFIGSNFVLDWLPAPATSTPPNATTPTRSTRVHPRINAPQCAARATKSAGP